jgi:purine-binding chemotaxis protein CheW
MIFQLGGQTYGTPILCVREVIEYKSPKPVPNVDNGFEGVINLRGEVIGVVDLRKVLKIAAPPPKCLIVFESGMGLMAVAVDKMLSVLEIADQDLETRENSGAKEGQDYFIGIGKTAIGLVTILDLNKIDKLLKRS